MNHKAKLKDHVKTELRPDGWYAVGPAGMTEAGPYDTAWEAIKYYIMIWKV